MEPYQQRMIDEHAELTARIERCRAFLNEPLKVRTLSSEDRTLLEMQLWAMDMYADVLSRRIKRIPPVEKPIAPVSQPVSVSRFTTLCDMLCEQYGADVAIDLYTNIREEFGFDSLDIVELVMTVEEEFGIELSDEQLEKVRTVGDALELLSRALGPE